MMTLRRLTGWSVGGILFLSALVYAILPHLITVVIIQELEKRGFQQVALDLDYPTWSGLRIHSFSITKPSEAGALSISSINTNITYRLPSLWKERADTILVEHMAITWDPQKEPESETSLPHSLPSGTTPNSSTFVLPSLADLPILPFQQLAFQQIDISNPLAPPPYQHTTGSGVIEATEQTYEGTLAMRDETLPMNVVTFVLDRSGKVSVTGAHTTTPQQHRFSIQTAILPNASNQSVQGQLDIDLQPLIQLVAILYPLNSETQAIFGSINASWEGKLPRAAPTTLRSLGSLQGQIELNVNVPTLSPAIQDLQSTTFGSFHLEANFLKVVLQPSSTGKFDVLLDTWLPDSVFNLTSYQEPRSITWEVPKSIQINIPMTEDLKSARISTGQLHMKLNAISEKLDLIISADNINWKTTDGFSGQWILTSSGSLAPTTTSSMTADTISWDLRTSMSASQDRLLAKWTPKSQIQCNSLTNQSLHIPLFKGVLHQEMIWEYEKSTKAWKLQPIDMHIHVPEFTLDSGRGFLPNWVVMWST